MQKTGVVLLAFGKRGYAFAAINLSLSIKHFNKDIRITIIHDRNVLKQVHNAYLVRFVDNLICMEDSESLFDAGFAKMNIYNKLPYENNLFIDVDTLCLKDIQPFLTQLESQEKPFVTNVESIGQNVWIRNEDYVSHYRLTNNDTIWNINTSWMFIKKSDEAKNIFDAVLNNFKTKPKQEKILFKWGKSTPDELILSGTISQLKYSPQIDINPMFFGRTYDKRTPTQLINDYYFLSIYGNGTGNTITKLKYFELYDLLVNKYCKEMGLNHLYKVAYIKLDKHINQ